MRVGIIMLIFVGFVFSGAYLNPAHAQTKMSYANIKVDELSDAQIRQWMQRAAASGYSDEQLAQMATAQGLPAEEVKKLTVRVEELRKQDSGALPGNVDSVNLRNNVDSVNLRNAVVSKQTDLKRKKSNIFGADLFSNGDLTFEPNLRLATPANYVIGPDDELLIDLSGDNEASYRLRVSPEGIIRLQFVGNVSVAGLTIEQAKAKIRLSMIKTYPSLRSGRTSIAVNIGNIRSIKVILNGQVSKPGTYTLSSLSSVFNALYASGGPSENGSFRKIQVLRNNKVVTTVDIYDFLISGSQKGNIRLQDQDVINIPVYDTRVEIEGEVKHPAIYETIPGESLNTILSYAGGFTASAYKASVKAFQNTDKERKIVSISASEFSAYNPKNGDKYFVEAILDRFENRVEIEGAVFRPGFFELERGMSLSKLIAKAEGLKEDAFLNRGYINRLNADNTPTLISFDVQKIMSGTVQDIPLKREDKVTISSIFDLREEFVVSIQGEVRAPGSFPYAEGMRLGNIIQLAGGFKESAMPNRIEVARRIKNSDATNASARTANILTFKISPELKLEEDSTFLLQPYDIVSVRGAEGYVIQKQIKLEGEVLYPGYYTIQKKDERISDLIKRAGGLTALAFSEGASLKRPQTRQESSKDTHAIDKKSDEDKKLLNLKRLKQDGAARDTTPPALEDKLIESDLVGINLKKILSEPRGKEDLFVEDGDVIRVPKGLQTIKVTGEVLNPNNIVYEPRSSFRRYVNGAGGFTDNARRGRAYIRYANGSVKGTKFFLFFRNYPEVKPGSEILVPKRAEREHLTTQSWIGIGTAVASMAAIVVSLLK